MTAEAGFLASRNFDAPMTVVVVTEGSGAEIAGLQTGDTILEINGTIVGQESSEITARLPPGHAIPAKVRRRGSQREVKWKVGRREESSYTLKGVDNYNAEHRGRRAAWVQG